jgi:nucleoside-diphosphate-sugar epimerase
VSLRLCDTYGPADSRGKLLNLALKTIASRSRLDTTSGEQPLKLVHIHDVTRAVELALELPPSPDGQLEIYDVAPLHAATVREVLGYICKLAGVEPSSHFNFGSLPYHPREFHNEVAYKMLPNWSPKISLEDGLREVWEATQSN